MIRPLVVAVSAVSAVLMAVGGVKGTVPASAPPVVSYTATGEMKSPAEYREWVYLTSGLDMSYSSANSGDHQMFDNVFVNPESYREFVKTGTWPDKTVFVLEVRGAEQKVSINKRGRSQAAEVMGLEVHVKDATLPGGWGFFEFDPAKPMDTAKMVPQEADCYTCHAQHGAVDHTFVQFYPTLMGIATEKKTLSAAYLKEMEPVK